MTPRPTKRLKEGMLVTYRRGWIVPCGNGDKPQGVWSEGRRGKIRDLDGRLLYFSVPRGIQVEGEAFVKAGEP